MRNYVPAIPKKDLIDGEYYNGTCRNASIARWDAEVNKFRHWRTKFTSVFVEEISCPEDEQNYDVFVTASVLDAQAARKYIPLANGREIRT